MEKTDGIEVKYPYHKTETDWMNASDGETKARNSMIKGRTMGVTSHREEKDERNKGMETRVAAGKTVSGYNELDRRA